MAILHAVLARAAQQGEILLHVGTDPSGFTSILAAKKAGTGKLPSQTQIELWKIKKPQRLNSVNTFKLPVRLKKKNPVDFF